MSYVLDMFVENQYATTIYFKKWHQSHELFLSEIINHGDDVSVVDCSEMEKLPPVGHNFYQQENTESFATNTASDSGSMFCFIKNEIVLGYINMNREQSQEIIAALQSNPTLKAEEVDEDQINVKFAERKSW